MRIERVIVTVAAVFFVGGNALFVTSKALSDPKLQSWAEWLLWIGVGVYAGPFLLGILLIGLGKLFLKPPRE